MKNQLLVLSLLFSLVACGGSGGAGSPSPAPVPTPPAPVPAPPAPTPAACTGSPVVTDATAYIGVMPNGLMSTWRFDTASKTAAGNIIGTTFSETLTQDSATCSYTGSQTGALKTSFLPNGLGVTAVAYSGTTMPVFLITNPESDITKLAGTYNVLRYTTEVTANTVVTSDYATFNVDNSGNWALCPNEAFTTNCGGPSGSLSAHNGGGFDIILNGSGVGRLLVNDVGASKVMVVAISNPISQNDIVTGMWVGATNDAFVSGANDGTYITDTTDPEADVITVAGLSASTGSQSATLIANNPAQGMFTVSTGQTPQNVGFVSSLGLFATTSQATGAGAFLQFGVKQIK